MSTLNRVRHVNVVGVERFLVGKDYDYERVMSSIVGSSEMAHAIAIFFSL